MGEFGTDLIESIFRNLAVCHILKSADEQGTTLNMRKDMGHTPNVLDRASGCDNPEHEVNINALQTLRDDRIKREQIVRMDHIPNHLHCYLNLRIKLENAEGLLRPVVVIRHQVRDKTTRLAHSLSFGKTQVCLLDLLLRPFSVVNIDHYAIPPRRIPFRIPAQLAQRVEPSIYPISSSKSVLRFKGLARGHGMRP